MSPCHPSGARPGSPLTGWWEVDPAHQCIEVDVSYSSCVLSDHMDMWVQDDGMNALAVLGQKILKAKLTEIHALHKVTKAFRLKRSQSWITNLCAGLKISIDGLNQLFCDLNDLLFSHIEILVFSGGVAVLCGVLDHICNVTHHSGLWRLVTTTRPLAQ